MELTSRGTDITNNYSKAMYIQFWHGNGCEYIYTWDDFHGHTKCW